ncbi:glycoside hydrolase family 95 protein [Tamlana sp. 2201CG12-4]|uniref:glycoside hydrolase family 95 protein n=1 Tax=Tamlana sp. 2201CG12-4 TaxID=3112582 RepID=UPI002DB983CD|nr:glycoside hydrolase family 95 protein [Tamlana sp. 2201CG12-4]MEC3908634.1 glycoside hydrolase family 95 protein [Tamlana sp. 2201CG12-4]
MHTKQVGYLLLFVLYVFSCKPQNKNVSTLSNDERLWYKTPAKDWFEALPIGNGRLGAMIHGHINREHLQLNEESLWAGTPENPYPENVQIHYEQFQRLNLEGKFEEALKYGMQNLVVEPTSIRSYQPLGDLFITFDHNTKATNYKRSLDLNRGISSVTYEINGNRYLRESFISSKYDVLYYHFKSLDNAPVNAEISFKREKDIEQVPEHNQLHIKGQIFDDINAYDDNKGGSGKGGKHMKFDARIGLSNDQNTTTKGKNMLLSNTNEFTIILSAATDYNINLFNYDRSISPGQITNSAIQAAKKVPYKQAKEEHIHQHSSMYKRVQFKISDITKDTIPTNLRLQQVANGNNDNYLTQVFFQYGRYLLMNSSAFRAKLPANLQGIWNKDMWAAWESDYHLNINLQMNYWAADLCNLSETIDPLSDFMTMLADRGKETAKRYIGSEGWMAHHSTNIFGRTNPSGSTKSSQLNNGYSYPIAGSWMTLTLWRHYEFTNDKNYLEKTAYPLLKGASRFVLDFLKENEKGELVTAPSYSPENSYIDPTTGKAIRNTVAATMDIQIIRDLFKASIEAENILKISGGLTKDLNIALSKLPKTRIGANGTIMEWYEDYEEVEPGHRHISHLYGLYPSNQITNDTPELKEAAVKTIERRLASGGGQTGWSRAWFVNFFARLQEGDKSLESINGLLSKQVALNLLDLHPPKIFQIDGNLGATAGIAEMLLQSHNNGIEILPALPHDWPTGHITGLKARGGFIVDIFWENGKATTIKILSQSGGKTSVHYKGQIFHLEMKSGEEKLLDIL